MTARYSDLRVGDTVFTVPETVTRIEALYETVPGYIGGRTYQRRTGEIRLTTRMGSTETVRTVKADALVHSDSLFSGCDQ